MLIKTPLPVLKYTSLSIALLASTQLSIYLLNILNLGASNTPKKKGNINATVA
jgi:hypothetical protein